MSRDQRCEEIARTVYEANASDDSWEALTLRSRAGSLTAQAARRALLREADTLLDEFPVLGGVTDEMVERGARGAWRHDHELQVWERGTTDQRLAYCELARAVLTAALGEDNDDE